MGTTHKIIIGDSTNMHELSDVGVHLIVTSPPYFNAPWDYPELFASYDDFLSFMRRSCVEMKRVLADGRIACVVCDDVLIDGTRYPVVADITKIFVEQGFRYRDRIVWVKPEGYIRISRRSGVMLQHPYPMYFYPDNVQESILVFQKGQFSYGRVDGNNREASRLDLNEYQGKKWYLNVWQITNVLPLPGRIEEGVAAFPDELARRLILLFSHVGETVLDPFLGSGTTMKVARELGRNSVGYEIDAELLPVIRQKVGVEVRTLGEDVGFEIIVRDDARRLRSDLQRKVGTRRSVAVNAKRRAKRAE